MAAKNLITDAHDKDTGFQCWEAFLSAELSEERPNFEEERRIYEEASKGYAKISMSQRQTRAYDTYTIKRLNIVWCKSVTTDVAVTTGYQQMRNGTLQKLGIWKYNRVLKGHNVTYKKVRRSKKSFQVCPREPFLAFIHSGKAK